MSIPNLTVVKVANPDGSMHQDFHNFLSQLIIELQRVLSPEGYKLPELTSAQIAQLNTAASKTAIAYNTQTNEAVININGVFKTIQTA